VDNVIVARALLEMADAMEYLDDNAFKIQAFRKAAAAVMNLREPIDRVSAEGRLPSVPGIGKSIEARVRAWVEERDFSDLEEMRIPLPAGLHELLKVPGLGHKWIRLSRTIGRSDPGKLLEAQSSGRLQGSGSFPGSSWRAFPRRWRVVIGYRGKWAPWKSGVLCGRAVLGA
jgi:DNA polymerase (family 10)